MLVTSIFSFSQYVFYSLQNKFQFSVTFILSSANPFNFDQSKNLLFCKELKTSNVIRNSCRSTCTNLTRYRYTLYSRYSSQILLVCHWHGISHNSLVIAHTSECDNGCVSIMYMDWNINLDLRGHLNK